MSKGVHIELAKNNVVEYKDDEKLDLDLDS
jgi:hypothetical protein